MLKAFQKENERKKKEEEDRKKAMAEAGQTEEQIA